jgi:hypothetical protein
VGEGGGKGKGERGKGKGEYLGIAWVEIGGAGNKRRNEPFWISLMVLGLNLGDGFWKVYRNPKWFFWNCGRSEGAIAILPSFLMMRFESE